MKIEKNENPLDEYIHPLFIDGERYFLNKNPFEYAEEGVSKYWSQQVDELICELTWQEFIEGKPSPSSPEKLAIDATRRLIPQFLADEYFIKYFKQDGGDLIKEIKEVKLFPEKHNSFCYEEEREVS